MVKSNGYYDTKLPDFREGYLTIGTDGINQTTPYHEIGHMVECYDKDIVRTSKEWIAERTKGEDYTRLNEIFKGVGYGNHEIIKKDNFITPYIGKAYNDATEVFSIGLESIYTPGVGQVQSIDDNGNWVLKKITDDPDYLNLVIGFIATGGR